MKVSLTMSGGFANIQHSCSVDTATLPRDTARRLELALCDDALFAEHPDAPHARDARVLVLEVDCGSARRRTSFSEAAIPADARPVVEILRPLCRIVRQERSAGPR